MIATLFACVLGLVPQDPLAVGDRFEGELRLVYEPADGLTHVFVDRVTHEVSGVAEDRVRIEGVRRPTSLSVGDRTFALSDPERTSRWTEWRRADGTIAEIVVDEALDVDDVRIVRLLAWPRAAGTHRSAGWERPPLPSLEWTLEEEPGSEGRAWRARFREEGTGLWSGEGRCLADSALGWPRELSLTVRGAHMPGGSEPAELRVSYRLLERVRGGG